MLWEAYKLWNRDAFYKVGAVDERHWGKPVRILPIQLGVMWERRTVNAGTHIFSARELA